MSSANDMSRIDFSDLESLVGMTDEEIVAKVKRKGFASVTGGPGDPKESASRNICERCGAEERGSVEYTGRRYCTCGPKIRAAQAAIRQADLSGNMTFANLAKDSDEGTTSTALKLRQIATGERLAGVFMFGLPGRGKTHLQMATARACLEAGRLVGVYSLASLVSRIQETYGYSDGAETKTKILEEVASHEVVILDDVGKEHRSPDTESIVYQLVDLLYRKKRILVASSNLPGSDFVERYDGAVLSRIGGMCEKVVIRGEDRRKAAWAW